MKNAEEFVRNVQESGGQVYLTGPDGSYRIPTEKEAMGVCELCGVAEELRPYGPGGKNVCFDCAMRDEEEAKRQFYKQFK